MTDSGIQEATNIRHGLQILSAVLALAICWFGSRAILKLKLSLHKLAATLLLAAIMLFVASRVLSATGLLPGFRGFDLWNEIAEVLFTGSVAAAIYLLSKVEPRAIKFPRESPDLDRLTKLYNQAYFRRAAARRVEQSGELQMPMALIMLNVDDFASYNETFGREAADVVLSRVSQTLREVVRAGDLVARYGEDTFAVLMINYLEHACIAAEKIRSNIESKCSPQYDPSLKRQVTVSLGAAALKEEECSVDALIKAAEHEMNRASKEGKNRVSLATRQSLDSLPSQGETGTL